MAAGVFLVFVTGCAAVAVRTRLRGQDDLAPVAGATPRLYELPDSAAASPRSAAWGHLEPDSLVLYRPFGGATLEPAFRREVRRLGASGLAIGGYTLADGRHVRFDGHVRLVGDQLEFVRISTRSMERAEGPERFVVAPGEVRSVDVWIPSAGRTAMMVGLIAVLGAAAVAGAVASSLDQSAM